MKPLSTLNSQLSTTAGRISFADSPTETALVPTEPNKSCEQADSSTDPAHFALSFSAGGALAALAPTPKKPRNGKVAHLPKPEREMVNLMLKNNTPYYCIEDALHDRGFQVSQRNISNWKTRGGYQEWCAAQAQALELHNFQDNLTDFLRRHDAAELPEVGLQSVATNLSAILLRPDLMRQLLAEPDKYAKLIELQCRLAREIHTLQKDRDEVSKAVGGNPERNKRLNQETVENVRKLHTSNYNDRKDCFVPPRNFIPKQLEPVHKLTYAEKKAAEIYGALFEPKARTKPAPPSPNAQDAEPGSATPAA